VAALDRERIVATAVELADRVGIEPLTIRSLAAELGVGAMSIYHYLPNKDRIMDAMVDAVFAEIEMPRPGEPWRAALHRRTASARQALHRHRWAIGLMDSRPNPGPATLAHHDAVIGCLRSNGFSLAMTAHAFAVIDAYLYGFSLQAASLPFGDHQEMSAVAEGMFVDTFAADYPHLTELALQHSMRPDYRFEDEFDYGLELVLDGIERRLVA
jgi:AcrR family transcriptional regulator